MSCDEQRLIALEMALEIEGPGATLADVIAAATAILAFLQGATLH